MWLKVWAQFLSRDRVMARVQVGLYIHVARVQVGLYIARVQVGL